MNDVHESTEAPLRFGKTIEQFSNEIRCSKDGRWKFICVEEDCQHPAVICGYKLCQCRELHIKCEKKRAEDLIHMSHHKSQALKFQRDIDQLRRYICQLIKLADQWEHEIGISPKGKSELFFINLMKFHMDQIKTLKGDEMSMIYYELENRSSVKQEDRAWNHADAGNLQVGELLFNLIKTANIFEKSQITVEEQSNLQSVSIQAKKSKQRQDDLMPQKSESSLKRVLSLQKEQSCDEKVEKNPSKRRKRSLSQHSSSEEKVHQKKLKIKLPSDPTTLQFDKPVLTEDFSKILKKYTEVRTIKNLLTQDSRPFSLQLIFRASDCGRNDKIKQFWRKCKGVKNTLFLYETIHRTKAGAYTPILWEQHQQPYYLTDESNFTWLFSLTNPTRLRFQKGKHLTYENKRGPIFGDHDLEFKASSILVTEQSSLPACRYNGQFKSLSKAQTFQNKVELLSGEYFSGKIRENRRIQSKLKNWEVFKVIYQQDCD